MHHYRLLQRAGGKRLMIVLGILLILGTAGLSIAAIWANDGILTDPAAAVELFGKGLNVSVGQLLLAGAIMGATALLGLAMIIGGVGRNARRRSTGRHQLRDHQQELQKMRDLRDADITDRAASRRANDEAAENDGIPAGR